MYWLFRIRSHQTFFEKNCIYPCSKSSYLESKKDINSWNVEHYWVADRRLNKKIRRIIEETSRDDPVNSCCILQVEDGNNNKMITVTTRSVLTTPLMTSVKQGFARRHSTFLLFVSWWSSIDTTTDTTHLNVYITSVEYVLCNSSIDSQVS
jgi:hypothetical protein